MTFKKDIKQLFEWINYFIVIIKFMKENYIIKNFILYNFLLTQKLVN